MGKINRRNRTVSGQPINPKMGEGRFQDALRRLRNRIAGGVESDLDDSNEIGFKHTYCAWGMCSGDKEQWPDKDDHIFPVDFEDHGRISRREIPYCPLDTRENRRKGKKDGSMYPGCFYKCRAFHQDKYGKLTKEKVLELFDQYIELREKKYGRKTTEMDKEPWRQKV